MALHKAQEWYQESLFCIHRRNSAEHSSRTDSHPKGGLTRSASSSGRKTGASVHVLMGSTLKVTKRVCVCIKNLKNRVLYISRSPTCLYPFYGPCYHLCPYSSPVCSSVPLVSYLALPTNKKTKSWQKHFYIKI